MNRRDPKIAEPIAIGLDVFFVVAFCAIGRRNHDEMGSVDGVLITAAPFLISLALVWITPTVRRAPTAVRTGVAVWLITVAGGMMLRRVVFDRGTALAFVLVATCFVGATIIGWRCVASLLDARDQRRGVTAGW